jgi:uncharacterized Fe-S cluster-containing protein
MKAIIIEEERFTEVCDLMKAQVLESTKYSQYKPEGLTTAQWQQALEAAHGTINYVFVRWAQSHGASCTKR